jgi:hypothetical protein
MFEMLLSGVGRWIVGVGISFVAYLEINLYHHSISRFHIHISLPIVFYSFLIHPINSNERVGINLSPSLFPSSTHSTASSPVTMRTSYHDHLPD